MHYGKRIFLYKIWNFSVTPIEEVMNTVDRAVTDGFNAIAVHILWSRAQPRADEYDFEPYDRMLDYIINEIGLPVIILVDFCRFTRMLDRDGVLLSDEVQRDRFGNVGAGGAFESRVMPSFASGSAMKKMIGFLRRTVTHFNDKYGKKVLYYLAANTPYCETEYWCTGGYDYSEAAKQGFSLYLKDIFGNTENLNNTFHTGYASFEEIIPPDCSDVGNMLSLYWYIYRHKMLKRFIDSCADTVHDICSDKGTGFSVQFGSTIDQSILLRGTVMFWELCEKADLVWVDDAPDYNHAFSCDYTLSNLPCGAYLAQEIDGPSQTGATPEKYQKQGLECFGHGCQVVGIANWFMDDKYERYRPVWRSIRDNCLDGHEESSEVSYSEVITVKLSRLLHDGDADEVRRQYEMLSAGEDKCIKINIENDLNSIISGLGGKIPEK